MCVKEIKMLSIVSVPDLGQFESGFSPQIIVLAVRPSPWHEWVVLWFPRIKILREYSFAAIGLKVCRSSGLASRWLNHTSINLQRLSLPSSAPARGLLVTSRAVGSRRAVRANEEARGRELTAAGLRLRPGSDA